MYALLMYVQCSDVVVDDDEDDMTSYDHTLLLTELSSMLARFRNPAVTHTHTHTHTHCIDSILHVILVTDGHYSICFN